MIIADNIARDRDDIVESKTIDLDDEKSLFYNNKFHGYNDWSAIHEPVNILTNLDETQNR